MRVKNNKIESDGLARLGIIKIGEKKISEKTGKEYPVSLDYFKATGNNSAMFEAAYGEKPSSIKIIFISDDDDSACNELMEYRQGRALVAAGDGEIFKVWDKEKNNYAEHIVSEYKNQGKRLSKEIEAKYPKGEWKHIVRLRFFILDPNTGMGLGNAWGYWEFVTAGEKSSLKNIISAFDSSKERMKGKIMSTIFSLNVEKVTSNNPGEKKIYPVVTLIPYYNQEQMEYISNGLKQLESPQHENNNRT